MPNHELSYRSNLLKSAKKAVIRASVLLIWMFATGILFGPAFLFRLRAKSRCFLSAPTVNFVSVPDQITGIRLVFDEQKINLEIEYMDTKRLDTPENKEVFYQV